MFNLSQLFSNKREPEIITKVELLPLLPHSIKQPVVWDRRYRLPTDDEVFALIGADPSFYTDDFNDCDDYAWRAKGLAAGTGWPFAAACINGNHVINGWLNDQRQWRWYEPQDRRLYAGVIRYVSDLII